MLFKLLSWWPFVIQQPNTNTGREGKKKGEKEAGPWKLVLNQSQDSREVLFSLRDSGGP